MLLVDLRDFEVGRDIRDDPILSFGEPFESPRRDFGEECHHFQLDSKALEEVYELAFLIEKEGWSLRLTASEFLVGMVRIVCVRGNTRVDTIFSYRPCCGRSFVRRESA